MSTVVVRRALPEDAHGIAPVHVACWHEAYAGLVPQRCLDDLDAADWVAHWRARLERPGHVTATAVQDGRVVGVATVVPAEVAGLPPEELRSLYVVRAMWGRGVGRRLVQHLLDERPAFLWVFEGNERARRFYARTGWAATGDRRQDEWTQIPELRLTRRRR